MATDLAARRGAFLQDTERIDPDLAPLLERVTRQVATEDLLERSPENVVGAVRSLRTLAATRGPAQTLVHVFTPTVREQGWTSRRTIIDICTDDSPFLVDSITAAVSGLGCSLYLLVHPILDVDRDDEGRLLAVRPSTEGGAEERTEEAGTRSESWMHLEISRLTTAAHHAEAQARLETVLGDVRAAVTDWRPMRLACRDIVDALERQVPDTVEEATVEPTIEFLRWLADDNFTFLGYREYSLESISDEDVLRPVPGTGLGILHSGGDTVVHLRPEGRANAREARLLTITKANSRATVHRDAYLDYIGVRTFDEEGAVTGERRLLGLFTSTAYAASVTQLPIVAVKVAAIVGRSQLAPSSHSGKDLAQVLETYPRDELFQDSVEHLTAVATEVVLLAERRRPRIFLRTDEFGRFVSALVYLPRDRYTTTVRGAIERLLSEAFASESIDHMTKVSDSPLAQLHFIVRLPRGASRPEVDESELNVRLAAAIRTWQDLLVDHLQQTHDDAMAAEILSQYGRAFPVAYTEDTGVAEAAADIERLRSLSAEGDVRLHLYAPTTPASPEPCTESTPEPAISTRRFKMVTFREYPLTQVMPVLTALGVDVVDERPYRLTLADGSTRHISDFGLSLPAGEWGGNAVAAAFENAFRAVWSGRAENDTLGSLVLIAGLGWRDVVVLRALGRYLRQGGTAFSMEYIEEALVTNPDLAAGVVDLFHTRFDPDFDGDPDARSRAEEELSADLLRRLDDVTSLDEDRILRSLIAIVRATWRTNFYVRDDAGEERPWLSMKIDCTSVPGLPKPHPMVEIWVYSPRIEGVHLRFGMVARGGLRWSDRREDFRTEVLGLVKAQMVKNAVIVPTGSKGGFVAKGLPPASDRGAWLAEGKDAYRSFIRGMLDVTDNRVGDEVVTPERVVRHDGDDPYLVVAADKGTAAFSDTANEISRSYGFWLDDAFASGGSAGYDHKDMGITARGAWESTERHFRELGHDTRSEDFTVVGIGDMSGDVFGNGMRRSRHIRLVAAFDHRHVFVDPDPDAEAGFAERERLYHLPRSTWDDYDQSLISPGGGVFPRTAKSVSITPEMRDALGVAADVEQLTPSELIHACLRAPVDLVYNGGIGTYIKASTETDGEIGDRANDAVRLDGKELRARVVVEGGNLGVSQRGRIEAARAGVQINTDAIDNSAGVGTSDREVNLKLGFTELIRAGELTLPERNELLAAMTDEVAMRVLRDNYDQNVLIGNSRPISARMLGLHQRLMQWLEARGELDRPLEFLPDDAEIITRLSQGRGLERPEFAVLMAYAKLAVKADLGRTDIAEDPWFSRVLADYFPSGVRERFASELEEHPLRAEIIINSVANSMINRGGITFAYRAADETGAGAAEIARAFVAAREVFDMAEFTAAVEARDAVVSTEVQTRLYLDFRRVLDRASRWFLHHRDRIDIAREVETFAGDVRARRAELGDFLRGRELAEHEAAVAAYREAGADEELAAWGAGLLAVLPLLDIVEAAQAHGWDIDDAARVYYALADRVGFADVLAKTSRLPLADRWSALARSSLRDELYGVMVALTVSALGTDQGAGFLSRDDSSGSPEQVETLIDAWLTAGGAGAARALETLAAISAVDDPSLATVSVALRKLRSLTR